MDRLQELKKTVEWAVAGCSFIVKGKGKLSGEDFANAIENYVDCDTPTHNNPVTGQPINRNGVARDVVRKCVTSISVGWDGRMKCIWSIRNINIDNLKNWGIG